MLVRFVEISPNSFSKCYIKIETKSQKGFTTKNRGIGGGGEDGFKSPVCNLT